MLLAIFLLSVILTCLVTPTLGVIGGNPVPADTYPYLVSIWYRRDPTFRCGGVIYSESYVITTEHNIHCSEGYEQVRGVRNVSVPLGRNTNDEPGDRDIAVLTLAKKLDFKSGNIRSATFPPTDFQFPATATVVGWGPVYNEKGAGVHMPLSVEMPFVDKVACEAAYGKEFPATVCYGATGKSGCGDDAGGPLICDNYIVCGIFNTAKNCGEGNVPGIFYNVHISMGFIEAVTSEVSGRSISTKGAPDRIITSCGGSYETVSIFIKLEGLSSGQKCFFLIKTPLEKITLEVTETTLLEQDKVYVTLFCLADPCKRWEIPNSVGSKKTVPGSLIRVTIDIATTKPSERRGVTLSFNSSGAETDGVPSVTGFTVLNSSTPSSYSFPQNGGEYKNHEFGLIVFDMPKGFTVRVTRMDIEGSGSPGRCIYDAVSIFAYVSEWFVMKARICGITLPQNSYEMPGGFGILTMISDDQNVGKGFALEYK